MWWFTIPSSSTHLLNQSINFSWKAIMNNIMDPIRSNQNFNFAFFGHIGSNLFFFAFYSFAMEHLIHVGFTFINTYSLPKYWIYSRDVSYRFSKNDMSWKCIFFCFKLIYQPIENLFNVTVVGYAFRGYLNSFLVWRLWTLGKMTRCSPMWLKCSLKASRCLFPSPQYKQTEYKLNPE